MNKKIEITKYNRMIAAAQNMQSIALQNFNLAAQIESEAKAALVELGVQPGRARKGKYELPPDIQAMLEAGLTNRK